MCQHQMQHEDKCVFNGVRWAPSIIHSEVRVKRRLEFGFKINRTKNEEIIHSTYFPNITFTSMQQLFEMVLSNYCIHCPLSVWQYYEQSTHMVSSESVPK